MKKEHLQQIPSFQDIDAPINNNHKEGKDYEMLFIASFKQFYNSMQEIDHYVNALDKPKEEDEDHSFDQKEIESIQLQIIKTPSKKKKKGCVCKKTKCLKLYCECFYLGKACTEECSCFNCCNNEQKAQKIDCISFPRKSKNHQGCNCKKSNCQKKYCECFNAGKQCGSHCNCCDCHNIGTKAKLEDSPQGKEEIDQ